ncbi:GvpL/GvpF family gas vesicle protein [Streptomyces sp. NPDC101149]|uniref:GvpL/GvpF family gas vesicle protein n=1 Tax=Streptomyces sp. NPDC101149 TaxID=3366113 RepID=UPI00382817A6
MFARETLGTRLKGRVQEEDAAQFPSLLEPAAGTVSVGAQSTCWPVNLSFLVTQALAGEFPAAVEKERLARAARSSKRGVSGPLPPYKPLPGPRGAIQGAAH